MRSTATMRPASANTFRPMLAATADLKILTVSPGQFLASPKLDGIRCVVRDGQLFTRTMKLVPNKRIQAAMGGIAYMEGFDGELIVGDPTAPSCYVRTESMVMSKDAPIDDLGFWVFDIARPGMPYADRLENVRTVATDLLALSCPWLVLTPQIYVMDKAHLLDIVASHLTSGYEGTMLRCSTGTYKFGRSTLNEQGMLKIKPYKDSEAVILDIMQGQHNTNTAERNELGLTKRSSVASGQIPSATAGAMLCIDVHSNQTITVAMGKAIHALRRDMWLQKGSYIGRTIKYRFFQYGSYELPRHPRFLQFVNKDLIDTSRGC